MSKKKNILGINGSASKNASNLRILKIVAKMGQDIFNLEILDDLTELPHFSTELTNENVPPEIVEFRNKIEKADGVIICTPEYVFSIPSGLKNAIEWCVSTTVFSDKAVGLITASASGEKGHEELQLIMKTLQAHFTKETTLLIKGIKGKVNISGELIEGGTKRDLEKFVESFNELMESPVGNKINWK